MYDWRSKSHLHETQTLTAMEGLHDNLVLSTGLKLTIMIDNLIFTSYSIWWITGQDFSCSSNLIASSYREDNIIFIKFKCEDMVVIMVVDMSANKILSSIMCQVCN